MSKKIVVLTLTILGLIYITNLWVTREDKWVFSKQIGDYTIQTRNNNGLCGDDRVIDSTGNPLVTLRMCEDNVDAISNDGEWLIITSTTGRFYKRNLTTGEEILSNKPTHGFGGGIGKIE